MARTDGKIENQHYVPKILLRGFLAPPAEKEQIHVFDKHTEKNFLTNIKNIAVERGYYDLNFEGAAASLEPALSTLENNTNEAFGRLIETQDLAALSDEQKSWVPMFIAIQHLRVKQFREMLVELNNGFAEHIRSMGHDPKTVEGFVKIETDDEAKEAALAFFATSARQMFDLISTKVCFLTRTTPDHPFWISDNPVTMHNYNDFGPYGNIGFGVPGIQIYLPITSTLALGFWCETVANEIADKLSEAKKSRGQLAALGVLGQNVDHQAIGDLVSKYDEVLEKHEPFLEKLQSGEVIDASPENVTFYNSLQVTWSHRYVISQTDDFALAKKMLADDPKYKKGLAIKWG